MTLGFIILAQGHPGPHSRRVHSRLLTSTVQAVYYRDKDGKEPVNDFIDDLPAERQKELDYKIGLLNRLTSKDPPLPFPHSSQVDGQLRELRCHYGRDLYRILHSAPETFCAPPRAREAHRCVASG